ncbi:arginase [Lichenibacterium dinghuense]|uniref:arginase n=1 Tax=Lichenibacterium dinghuense TaxID=2895977 RepID=UPI001F00DBC4|nr:arginase [Lichenibacterium sp. 6Y81]
MHEGPCALIGAPVEAGTGRRGCGMGPAAYAAAGLAEALTGLGFAVEDRGSVARGPLRDVHHPNRAIRNLAEIAAWTAALDEAAYAASRDSFPIFLGGDHSLSAGTIAGMSRRAAAEGRELWVVWLDAHPDLHTLDTTESGNLHGTPMAYLTGRPGFAPSMPGPAVPVRPEHVCMIGLRSVDPVERRALAEGPIEVHDMRSIDERGLAAPLAGFLARAAAANAMLHVSLDVDFLDPGIAPGVGTTVPGGATFREAHLAMEMLRDSGLVRSLDLVELNPFLDERGRTAILMVDLAASLMGRRILDRPTRSS